MQQAACAGSPTPDAWHDVKPRAVEWAVSVCRSCPVTPECLQFALSDPHLEGVWGGLTVDERAKVARRNRRSERLAAERKARQNEQS
jgi:hypothetical protein